jgi:hypothetical protein
MMVWLGLFILQCGYSLTTLKEDDIYFEKADNGYDLYIRKYDDIGSLLLTESQKDPAYQKTNYGLRTNRFHPANEDQIRILDNKEVHTRDGSFFLVDSTPENHPVLGPSFRFFLPDLVYYGYKWSRQGFIRIRPGMQINVRLFMKPYTDYSGPFQDQWILLKLNENPSRFRDRIIETYRDLAKQLIIEDQSNLQNQFIRLTDRIPEGDSADIVFILDTTESMKEEIPVFKKAYPEIKRILKKRFKQVRIGLIFYKDYGSSYLYKKNDLTEEIDQIDQIIAGVSIQGGDDIPEAVYEGVHVLGQMEFRLQKRVAFLIGDAPPHPVPRGKIGLDQIREVLQKLNIELTALALPYQ